MGVYTVIKDIATSTRKWAELEVLNFPHLDPTTLGGFCAHASVELFKRYKRAGFSPQICLCESPPYRHFFVKVQDYTVDVTISQYRSRMKIFISKVSLLPYHKADFTFFSSKEAIAHQVTDNWMKEQIALEG